MGKAKVFVIMPFDEDFLELYNKLREDFKDNFEFTNAGDLDNQQNILQDIVEGIYKADVIIADLTGLNPNVFYELGLAHAMNKKVVIITQDISELPFDIKSYRVNEYSLKFNKIIYLEDELEKLLFGAINGDIKYGNPVLDYIPNYFKNNSEVLVDSPKANIENSDDMDNCSTEESKGEKGFFDFIVEIEENSEKMNKEIINMSNEMNDMNSSIEEVSNEIEQVKDKSGNVNANFFRNVCRRLSKPVDSYADKLKIRVREVAKCWDIIENGFLSLLDNKYMHTNENYERIKVSMDELVNMQSAIHESNEKIKIFINVLHESMGLERRLNRAFSMLITELENYLLMTEMMDSSVDRIIAKGSVVIGDLENNN